MMNDRYTYLVTGVIASSVLISARACSGALALPSANVWPVAPSHRGSSSASLGGRVAPLTLDVRVRSQSGGPSRVGTPSARGTHMLFWACASVDVAQRTAISGRNFIGDTL